VIPKAFTFPKSFRLSASNPGLLKSFIYKIENEGRVLIPRLEIFQRRRTARVFLAVHPNHKFQFFILQGIQGQFVDQTSEDQLRQDKELLLEEQLKNQDIIKQKSERLEEISKRLASYLSPQVFDSIFSSDTTVSKNTRGKT